VEWSAVKYFGDSRKAPPGAYNSLTMAIIIRTEVLTTPINKLTQGRHGVGGRS